MNCPRCDAPAETQDLQQFGGVCAKCLLEFAAEKDAPSFPNLEIVSTLGEGGMGVVYKAVQKQLGRTVALKVLSPRLSTDPAFVERFTREAKALAQLDHPNIVGIYDSGVHDGVPFLIMEFVEGHSLRKLLASRKMTAEQALQVVPQICDALQYAHARGVVHRDVKPENILIDREGRVKIADFGLAKLAEPDQTRITKSNVVMGTPHYMAPEQIENPSAVDHRADLYSLGVIFYEMLTGELPLGRFKAPSERADVDRRLDPVVLRSLEKEPGDRYQSAGEVKDHVTRLDEAPAGRDRVNPFVRASAILMALSLVAVGVGFCLPIPPWKKQAEISLLLGTCLMMAAFVISIVALSPLGRRAGGDRRLAWVTLPGSFLSLAVLGGGFASGSAPRRPARPSEVASAETRLDDAWPHPDELPKGLKYERIEEGEEVYRGDFLPKEVLQDLTLVRKAELAGGNVILMGFEFKSEYARRRWLNSEAFAPWTNRELPPKGGVVLSFGTVPGPEGDAAADVLRPLLQRKLREAPGR